MKTKLIALIAALALMLSLGACGKKNPTGSVKPNESQPPEVSGSFDGSGNEDNSGDNDEFAVGATNGGTYENAFIGIGCSLDSDWTYATEAEIDQFNGITSDSMTEDEIVEALENSSAFYDMYAMADEGVLSINVVMENLGVLYGMALDEESYVDTALGTLESALTENGYSNVSCEKKSYTFAGEEHFGTLVYAELQGVSVYEKQVCVKAGNYMAVITFASLGEDVTDEMLGYFYAL